MSSDYLDELIADLHPKSAIEYLRYNGWQQVGRQGDRAEVWAPTPDAREEPKNKRVREVIIPLHNEFTDYNENMRYALNQVSYIEGKSIFTLIKDISSLGFDIVRIGRNIGDNDYDIPLIDAKNILQNGIELLTASARAAIEPRAVYASRRPYKVDQYINSLRLGHTEHGSFVMAVYSPVEPVLSASEKGELFGEDEIPEGEPFSRLVLYTMTEATSSLLAASYEEIYNSPQEYLQRGVSSNLCFALAGLNDAAGNAPLALTVNWATNRPVTRPSQLTYNIDVSKAEVLQQAGEFFRTYEPVYDVEVEGYVIRLHREVKAQTGSVTILDIKFGSHKKVVVQLGGENYNKAVTAHNDEKRVYCRGDLIQRLRSTYLENVKDLYLVE